MEKLLNAFINRLHEHVYLLKGDDPSVSKQVHFLKKIVNFPY